MDTTRPESLAGLEPTRAQVIPLGPLIDVHSHHYPDNYLAACRRPDSGFQHYVRDDGRLVVLQDNAVALAVPQPLPDIEHRLRLMDEAGVQNQVLSVSAPNVFSLPEELRVPLTRDVNDELAAMAAGTSGRLRVFASLPLPDIESSLSELDRIADVAEVVGVVLCTTIARRTLDDPVFAPVWTELSRRRTVVFVHPTTGCCTEGVRDFALSLALDFLAETTNAIGRLVYSGTFERFPGIRWIFSHLGGTVPFIVHRFDNYATQFPEARQHITRRPSEYLRELTFDTVSTHVAAMRCAFATFGPQQFVFGTDYPHVPGDLGVFAETLRAAGLSPDDQARVEHLNARTLLGL